MNTLDQRTERQSWLSWIVDLLSRGETPVDGLTGGTPAPSRQDVPRAAEPARDEPTPPVRWGNFR